MINVNKFEQIRYIGGSVAESEILKENGYSRIAFVNLGVMNEDPELGTDSINFAVAKPINGNDDCKIIPSSGFMIESITDKEIKDKLLLLVYDKAMELIDEYNAKALAFKRKKSL